ncbi:MAG: MFS transporter [Adlercreutzia equolifaciens]
MPSTHLEEKVAAKVEHSPLARFVEAGVLPISVVCGLLFFGYSSLLTFLTPYATEIGLARAASVFFVVYALAMFVTRPFTGRAFDRVGPHPVMVPAFVSFALGMVVLAFAANDWMILGAAALLGFGVGTVQSCGLAIAVRVTSDARLSVANATFYMLLDVGVGIGPILLGIVAPLIGYANLYLCMAVVGALAWPCSSLSPKQRRARGRGGFSRLRLRLSAGNEKPPGERLACAENGWGTRIRT